MAIRDTRSKSIKCEQCGNTGTVKFRDFHAWMFRPDIIHAIESVSEEFQLDQVTWLSQSPRVWCKKCGRSLQV